MWGAIFVVETILGTCQHIFFMKIYKKVYNLKVLILYYKY